ncbi:MAG: DUF2314 domain-containing protein [Phycisphaeraceae bacterium]|nr:DUF2314 domain-containing protein [Phycisphaeraceae bacterium]
MKCANQPVVAPTRGFGRGFGRAIASRALGVGLAVLAAGTCAWSGCASKDPGRPPNQEIRDPDRMVTVEDGDPRLVAATEEARRRWPEFEKAFQDRGTSRRCFVKVRVDAEPRGYEYLWVEADMVTGNTIWGRVNSTPMHTTRVREGEPLTIYLPEVWDWAVSQGERIVAGGFQAKVLERGTP